MRRFIFWATVISGIGAAYLMYRRGMPIGTIARDTVTSPIGTFAAELKTAL